jgi:hypothetical protein
MLGFLEFSQLCALGFSQGSSVRELFAVVFVHEGDLRISFVFRKS